MAHQLTMGKEHLDGQFKVAAAQASAASDDVKRISAQKLAEIQKLPSAKRLAHADDPALTPQDRDKLKQSLGAQLRKTPTREPSRVKWTLVPRWVRYNWGKLLFGTVGTVAVLFGGFVAWANTAAPSTLSVRTTINWLLPDGSRSMTTWEAGTPVSVTSINGNVAQLRAWIDHQGYARGAVYTDSLSR